MLALALSLPPFTALLCLALSRFVPTRLCALGAAGLLGIAALALAGAGSALPATLLDIPWFETADRMLRLTLQIDQQIWMLGLVTLAGGALVVAGLGLALPRDLRGFGGLPASLSALPALLIIALGNQEPVLTPLAWMLTIVIIAATLRTAMTAGDTDAPLIVGLAGACAALLLLTAALLTSQGDAESAALICLVLACLLMLGTAPINATAGALSDAPAGIGGALLAYGPALLGGYTLMESTERLTADPRWRIALTILGGAALLACSAGALGARSARRLLAWQHGAQQSLVLIAAAQGVAGQGATLALIVTAALTTLTAGFALAVFERRTGGDNLSSADLPAPLALPGLALLIAGASAAGLPGTLGFWGRAGLSDALMGGGLGWAIGPLLAGSLLLALSYLTPLAALWRGPRQGTGERAAASRLTMVFPLVPGLALLALGIFPARLGVGPQPMTLATAGTLIAAVLLIVLPEYIRRGPSRRPPVDPDERAAGASAPIALAESLAGLAWLGAPNSALNTGWEALLWAARVARRALLWFEMRYYLAGLTIALIVVILIFV